jgi:hypothetical protein
MDGYEKMDDEELIALVRSSLGQPGVHHGGAFEELLIRNGYATC